MGDLLQDLRYSIRLMRKNPGHTAVLVFTMALGIGANAAIFSVVDAVLLSRLPYANPRELVSISAQFHEPRRSGVPVSYTKFTQVHEESKLLDSVGACFSATVGYTSRGEPESVPAMRVTLDFFRVLGVTPQYGRGFSDAEEEPGGDQVAIITDSFWRGHFGADPFILGKSITLDGKGTVIIGVLPAGFRYPLQVPEPQIWLPRVFDIPVLTMQRIRLGAGFLEIIGRLKPDSSVPALQSELDTINSHYAGTFKSNADATRSTLTASPLEKFFTASAERPLIVLLAAVGIVLLIACANGAGLLLVRASARAREIAMRGALGCSRRRLVRQLLTESILLALLSGSVGALAAGWFMPLLQEFAARSLPLVEPIRINGSVLGFLLLICCAAGTLFGMAPALQATRMDINASLREGGARGIADSSGGRFVRSVLVVAELAIAFLLTTGAGLVMDSFANLMRVEPGFDPHHVTAFPIVLPSSNYPQPAAQSEFCRKIVEAVEPLPGVQSASVVSFLPLSGSNRYGFFCPEGRVCLGFGKDPLIALRQVSPHYFRTMRIAVLAGRAFEDGDDAASKPVVIVNEITARRFWPGQNPLGKHVTASVEGIPREVVGVVANVKFDNLALQDSEELYVPVAQSPFPSMTLVIRHETEDQPLVAAVRAKVRELAPGLPISGMTGMDHVVAASVAQPKLIMTLSGIFAFLALLLAAIGTYAVMSFTVSLRTHEMGIRLALGAQHVDLLRLVLEEGGRLTLIGLGLGLICALGLTHLLAALLFGVSPMDPQTFIGSLLLLAAVSMLASYLPARRALKVDPLTALRQE